MALTPDNQAFAARLKQAMKRCPKKIETPSELALHFNLLHTGGSVTNQAVQKWLGGTGKPSPEKIETLAAMLNVSEQWLRYGIPEARPSSVSRTQSPDVASVQPTEIELEILKRYRLLSAHQQALVADLIEQLAFDREMWVDAP